MMMMEASCTSLRLVINMTVGDGKEEGEKMERGYFYWSADDSFDAKQSCMMKSKGISHQILIYNHTLALEHNIEARKYLLFPMRSLTRVYCLPYAYFCSLDLYIRA